MANVLGVEDLAIFKIKKLYRNYKYFITNMFIELSNISHFSKKKYTHIWMKTRIEFYVIFNSKMFYEKKNNN